MLGRCRKWRGTGWDWEEWVEDAHDGEFERGDDIFVHHGLRTLAEVRKI